MAHGNQLLCWSQPTSCSLSPPSRTECLKLLGTQQEEGGVLPIQKINSDPQAPELPVQGQKSLPAPYSHIALTALTIPVWRWAQNSFYFSLRVMLLQF